MKLAWDSKKTAARQEGRYVRERSSDLYHTARWSRLSRRYRTMHPLCAECQRNGRIEPATCVDHIIPGQKDKKLIEQWRKTHNR